MNTAKVNRFSSIEFLESRIAPARIILAGVPNSLPGNDVDYHDTHGPDAKTIAADDAIFLNIKTQPSTDLIAKALGGSKAAANTYYMRMFAGDVLKIFTATNSTTDPFLTVTKGN